MSIFEISCPGQKSDCVIQGNPGERFDEKRGIGLG